MQLIIDTDKLSKKNLSVNEYLTLLSIYYKSKNNSIDYVDRKVDYFSKLKTHGFISLFPNDIKNLDYLKEIILPQLNENGFDSIEFCRVESDEGEHVMQHAALRAASKVDLRKGLVQIVGNAGNWVQNAGQFRMAVRYHLGRYGFDDEDNPQLCVVTDAFPLGTGVEPASTHQNPHSALGQIVRNYYILAKNTPAFR